VAHTTCTYTTSDGKPCGHPVRGPEPYCVLHYGCDRKSADELPDNPDFEPAFAAAIAAEDGDWQGFVFPRGVKFPKQLDFPISARECRFNALDLDGVVFTGAVDFTEAVFHGGTAFRNLTFEDTVTFEHCRFDGPVDFLNVQCKKSASFSSVDFSGRSILRINFQGTATFNQAVFREGVNFAGWRNITLVLNSVLTIGSIGSVTLSSGNKPTIRERALKKIAAARTWIREKWKRLKRQAIEGTEKVRGHYKALLWQFAKTDPDTKLFRMFESEGHFQDVVFLKPDQTLFSQVDLSRVSFRGTNLRGVRFLGVKWWQPKLGRNGLYDEVLIRFSKDGPFRHQYLPVLEETCRNARVALEDNRSFDMASDFYVGEMEAARTQLGLFRRHLFSVAALYRFVSGYGTSVGVALRILALLYALHLAGTLAIRFDGGAPLLVGSISEAALRSFKVLMQQTPETITSGGLHFQAWLDASFRVLGLIQVAMVALAFRSRIKRH
jgi:uncharacterized protein YjbI with pentapeptide repeats